ncbi:hypothetical protein SO694_00045252 [Aureococcus anophagefferens]|uniref:Uncharacterized protein n=1 Tax=Aureococcus anophagefferens TaxID=44056 RepID=A0ABR1G7N6_AURAN
MAGPIKWSAVAELIGTRNAKQCRERWHYQLNPEIKKGRWTAEEDALISALPHGEWARVRVAPLPGRTDMAIKNRYHTLTKRKCSAAARGGDAAAPKAKKARARRAARAQGATAEPLAAASPGSPGVDAAAPGPRRAVAAAAARGGPRGRGAQRRARAGRPYGTPGGPQPATASPPGGGHLSSPELGAAFGVFDAAGRPSPEAALGAPPSGGDRPAPRARPPARAHRIDAFAVAPDGRGAPRFPPPPPPSSLYGGGHTPRSRGQGRVARRRRVLARRVARGAPRGLAELVDDATLAACGAFRGADRASEVDRRCGARDDGARPRSPAAWSAGDREVLERRVRETDKDSPPSPRARPAVGGAPPPTTRASRAGPELRGPPPQRAGRPETPV